MGNFYATTLHVLTAAILKLGKITPADLVYRAPGGALPNSFWHKQMPECVQGGIELAFMSTTTAKEEAMAYARRAPGMILFEVVQGFVARGASISWLSQYPNEEEILFPPLTALEVSETRVEGALLIVQMIVSQHPIHIQCQQAYVTRTIDDVLWIVFRQENVLIHDVSPRTPCVLGAVP